MLPLVGLVMIVEIVEMVMSVEIAPVKSPIGVCKAKFHWVNLDRLERLERLDCWERLDCPGEIRSAPH